jgi:hypothetical protein
MTNLEKNTGKYFTVIAGLAIALILSSFMAVWWNIPGESPVSQCDASLITGKQDADELRRLLRNCEFQRSMVFDANKAKYDAANFEHIMRALYWQHIWAMMSFMLVLLVVCLGLYLSYLEFRPGDTRIHTFKVGEKGFELSSPVLGLIILALSLGFFSVYLINGLPITQLSK